MRSEAKTLCSPCFGLVTEFCACQSIETYPGFGSLYCKLSVNVRGNTYHEFAAEMFSGKWLRNRGVVLDPWHNGVSFQDYVLLLTLLIMVVPSL
jgi:hypothetical protein